MSEYVKKESLISVLPPRCGHGDVYALGYNTCRNLIEMIIKDFPAADVEPVKHGEWVAVECGTFCTNCKRVFDHHFQIPHHVCKELIRCPDCGAIMDGDLNG